MSNKKWILCLLIPIVSFGQDTVGVIKQIDDVNHRVAIKMIKSIDEGDSVFVTQDGKQCKIKIITVKDLVAVGDITECPFRENLKLESSVEESLFEKKLSREEEVYKIKKDEKSPVREVSGEQEVIKIDKEVEDAVDEIHNKYTEVKATDEAGNKIGLKLTYSFAKTLKVQGRMSATGYQDSTFTSEENTERALGIGVEYSTFKPTETGAIGGSFGLSYEFPREYLTSSGEIDGETYSSTYTEPRPTIDMIILHGNFMLAPSETSYFLGGLNVNIPSLDNSEVDITGGLGMQIGLGLVIHQNWNCEFQYRTLNMTGTRLDTFSGMNIQTDFEDIDLHGFLMSIKYIFN